MEGLKRVMKLILSVALLFWCGIVPSQNKGEQFVLKLTELGYFQYMDKVYVEAVKQEKINGYNEYETLIPTDFYQNNATPKDYRFYHCDGERVYEQGGIIELLKTLTPTFEKIDFKYEITNHIEEWDTKNQWLNHCITINGTKYILFENSRELGWGEAPLRIAQILNIEFSKQGIDERIYLISGGNDGWLVFLTPKLHQYISSVCKKDENFPYKLEEWAKRMGITPMKI